MAGTSGWGVHAGPTLASGPCSLNLCGVGVGWPVRPGGACGPLLRQQLASAPLGALPSPRRRCFLPPAPLPEPAGRQWGEPPRPLHHNLLMIIRPN